MQKKLYLGAILLSAALGASAEYITPEQALERVATQSGRKVKGIMEVNKDLLFTYPSENGTATMYVFGTKGREGYVLLSADDAAAPVLGYADRGNFDADNMPPQMKVWLEGYASQVEYAREKGIKTYKAPSKDSRKTVAPLMSTIWNQDEPFNQLTPKVNNRNTPTGCVATAMAQVMKYWNYPETPVGSGSITNPSTGRTETMQFGNENFEWKSMLNSYNDTYTEEEAYAVAYLMKACGYASDMAYALGMSGTFSLLAGKAMYENFLYNKNIMYLQRNYYNASEWDEIVYNEIINGRPILYGAQSTSGGHEFVCDGYSGDGFYHFNWGWGGMSDGYFILDALNPGALGTGGGAGGGFNFSQDILVGVQPEEEVIYQPTLTQFGQLSATSKELRLTFKVSNNGMLSQWVNTNLKEINVAIGASVESIEGSSETRYIKYKQSRVGAPEYRRSQGGLSLAYSGVNGQFSINFPEELADGRYKVTIVTKDADSDEWVPVRTEEDSYNYVIVTKKGEELEVEVLPEAVMTLDKAELKSELYYGSVASFEITVTNHSEREMTQGFYPMLCLNGQANLIGDGVVLTLQPNETVTREFTSQFRALSGFGAPTTNVSYQLRWCDPSDYAYYDYEETVTMKVSNLVPSLDITKFEIPDVESIKGLVPGAGMNQVYQITDIENIKIDLNLTNKRGFFGYPLYFVVFNPTSGASIMTSIFEPLLPLNEGESCELNTKINMSIGNVGTTYFGMLYYLGPRGYVEVNGADTLYFKLIGGSGVEEIEFNDDLPSIYYNLQGIEVKNPVKGQTLIRKQGAKTEKIIF